MEAPGAAIAAAMAPFRARGASNIPRLRVTAVQEVKIREECKKHQKQWSPHILYFHELASLACLL